MTAQEFENRVVAWARRHQGVEALIQIGSRAQEGAQVDDWSDWDYHLIVRDPSRFIELEWLEELSPVWNAHVEKTERGVAKVSVIFAGGWEADFVPLAAWQLKLVYQAMFYPSARALYPAALVRGIYNTRLIVRPGYKILTGGPVWAKRLAALQVEWPEVSFGRYEFRNSLAGFWRHAVWVYKKIARGELRAALRWLHLELRERSGAMVAEEAKIAGRASRPEARKAEQWLDERRLEQTAITTSPDQQVLARALLAEMTLFEEVSRSVATSRGFDLPDYSAVAGWLRSELNKLVPPA